MIRIICLLNQEARTKIQNLIGAEATNNHQLYSILQISASFLENLVCYTQDYPVSDYMNKNQEASQPFHRLP